MWLRKCLAVCLILAAFCFNAEAARLVWDANTASDLAGYKIHYGLASGQYTNTVDVGNVTEWQIPAEWPRDQNYYFAATAYDNEVPVHESGYSNEAIYFAAVPPPAPATNVQVAFQQVTQTMTTYFGECNSDGSLLGTPAGYDVPGGAAYLANINAVYTCPGSGIQNIDNLGIYARSGGAAGDIRCAIYDSSWNLVCQFDATINITDDTPSWREKLAANLTGALTLTGGASYYLVYTIDSSDYPQVGYNTGITNDWRWNYNDFMAGFPASIDAPPEALADERIIMRVGVTAVGGSVSVLPVLMNQYRARRQ